ncbi:hypothetical protein CDL15_Pgr012310 [Punica granatum]|uniref:Uncharacterized protein n=1 Tax=Punica granatum TaxID=22663 RepID=A0A218VWQ5_PUNGR|nr:hypothetical protein CDL15_Pgr012310 [Punica granatum]
MVGLVFRVVLVCQGCPDLAMRDSSSGLVSIDEGLSVVFKLLKIFWLREGKLASCIEKEEAEIFGAKGNKPGESSGLD